MYFEYFSFGFSTSRRYRATILNFSQSFATVFFFLFFYRTYRKSIYPVKAEIFSSIFDDNLLSFRLKSLILNRRYFKSFLFLSINVFNSSYETFNNNKASFQIFQSPFLFRDVFSQVARLPLTFIKLNLIDLNVNYDISIKDCFDNIA